MNRHVKPSTGGRAELARVVGVPGAVLMGLGSILGTGIFVSIGVAAGVTGPSVIFAVVAAAAVATFNGLSSAQLAASHPVSGGTYEYGYRYLGPQLDSTGTVPRGSVEADGSVGTTYSTPAVTTGKASDPGIGKKALSCRGTWSASCPMRTITSSLPRWRSPLRRSRAK